MMHFEEDYTYHVYNRSNQNIFYNSENYLYFLDKVKKHILPYSNLLAYCLIPNHFHFLINANKDSVKSIGEKHRPNTQVLSKQIGTLLSSYTQAINKQENRKGSLFSHNTKAKVLNNTLLTVPNRLEGIVEKPNYAKTCFFYIHQNPYNAGIVKKLEEWEYSSFKEYAGLRNGSLVNKKLAENIINFDKNDFYGQSYAIINDNMLKGIW